MQHSSHRRVQKIIQIILICHAHCVQHSSHRRVWKIIWIVLICHAHCTHYSSQACLKNHLDYLDFSHANDTGSAFICELVLHTNFRFWTKCAHLTNKMSRVISQTQDKLPCKEEGLDSIKESKCPIYRRNVESLFHNAIQGSIEPAKIVKHDKFRDSCSDKSLSSLVTVRSHQRKMPGSSKKKRSTPKSKIRKNLLADFKRVGTMDVASFREISRIQSVENETFKALKASSGSTGSRNKQIWNGFWSMAAKMESKKKRKPFTVIQSKEKRLRKQTIRHSNQWNKWTTWHWNKWTTCPLLKFWTIFEWTVPKSFANDFICKHTHSENHWLTLFAAQIGSIVKSVFFCFPTNTFSPFSTSEEIREGLMKT